MRGIITQLMDIGQLDTQDTTTIIRLTFMDVRRETLNLHPYLNQPLNLQP